MKALLLIAPLLTGCIDFAAPWEPGTKVTAAWPSEPARTGTWAIEVEYAVGIWADVVGPDCTVPFSYAATGGHEIQLISYADWPLAPSTTGSYDGDIIIVRGENPANRGHVLLHELGHALGLAHDEDPTSIMYFRSPNIATPTAADIANARAVLGC